MERAYHEVNRLLGSSVKTRMYISVNMKIQADREGHEEAFEEGKADGKREREKENAREIPLESVPIDPIVQLTKLIETEIMELQ